MNISVFPGGVGHCGGQSAQVQWRVVDCRNLRPCVDGRGRQVLRTVGRPQLLGPAGPDSGPEQAPQGGAELYHDIELRAVDATLASAEIPGRKLSRAYLPGDNALDHADHDVVTSDLARAYLTLARSAAADGMYLQPAVGRCKLYDASRRLLYTTPPVLLSNSNGPQCTDGMLLRSLDRQFIEPHQITVKCWRPQVVMPTSGIGEDVAYVELWLTPQIHPFNPSATAAIAMVRNGTHEFLRVQFPGVYTGLSSSHGSASRSLLERVVGAMERLERPVAELAAAPYSTTTVVAGPERTLAVEQRQLSAGLQRPVRTESAPVLPPLLSAPNSFTAACRAQGPVGVLWGGLTVQRYGGHPLSAFTAFTQDKSWTAWIAVDFADGTERVVWQGGGATGAPRLLMPMLSYPSADARRMTVQLSVDGEALRREVFELTPVSAANVSIYVHSTLCPFSVAEAAGQALPAPEAQGNRHDFPETIAVATALEPHRLRSALEPGCGAIAALSAAGGSQSAWDFGRPRFYAFCNDGILSVSATASLERLSATPVDGRRVSGADAVCMRDGKLLAVASGDLIQLQGNRAVTLRPACGYKSIAWINCRNELVGFRADGSLEYTASNQRFSVDWGLAPTAMTSDSAGRVLLHTAGGVYNLCEESAGNVGVDVELKVELSAPRPFAPESVTWTVGAESIRGTVSLRRRHLLAEASRPDAGLTLQGRLTVPLYMPVHTRPAGGWTLRLAGRMAAGVIERVEVTKLKD